MGLPVRRSSLALDFSCLSFLVVDDQPFSRRLIRSMLASFGSREIYESANGVEAFEFARTVLPSIIITDLVMPIFNGLRFIKMVKEEHSPARLTPIIVLSGYLTKAAALTVKESGVEQLLVKPVSPKVLFEHIARIVVRSDMTIQAPASAPPQKQTEQESPRLTLL